LDPVRGFENLILFCELGWLLEIGIYMGGIACCSGSFASYFDDALLSRIFSNISERGSGLTSS
jgi:hypothetical protein